MQRAVISVVALVLAVAGCAGRSGRPAHEDVAAATHAHQMTDTRRQISLTPAERDAVLVEMRTMLGSVSGVLHGLTADDRQAIEKAARASGMAMAMDPRLAQKLPRHRQQHGHSGRSQPRVAGQHDQQGLGNGAGRAGSLWPVLAACRSGLLGCSSKAR